MLRRKTAVPRLARVLIVLASMRVLGTPSIESVAIVVWTLLRVHDTI